MKNTSKNCPLCGSSIKNGQYKCKTCGADLSAGGGDATGQFSRAELTAITDAIRKKIKIFGWLAIVIFVLTPILAIGFGASLGEGGGPVLAVAALVVAFIFFCLWDSGRQKIKKLIKASFTGEIREMLANTFELESYEPNGYFSPEQLKETQFKSFDKCSGSDLVKGKYKGVPFAFCDLLLTEEITGPGSSDDDGTVTQLEGQWIEFKLKKQIDSTLYVMERRDASSSESRKKANEAKGLTGKETKPSYRPNHFGGKVQEAYTDNDFFNKNFQIFTDDPQTMYYVLTPHFMEYIIAADKTADSRSDFCFTGDRVRIALTNKRNLFDLSGDLDGKDITKSKDLDWVSDKFKSDIRFITDIFDALLKNEYLFGTEEK